MNIKLFNGKEVIVNRVTVDVPIAQGSSLKPYNLPASGHDKIKVLRKDARIIIDNTRGSRTTYECDPKDIIGYAIQIEKNMITMELYDEDILANLNMVVVEPIINSATDELIYLEAYILEDEEETPKFMEDTIVIHRTGPSDDYYRKAIANIKKLDANHVEGFTGKGWVNGISAGVDYKGPENYTTTVKPIEKEGHEL